MAEFTSEGDIRLTNGVTVPKDYGGLTHGYTVTSHAAQGKTVDTVLVAMGQESLMAANRQQLYVSVSRGREAVRLYTDDKAAMQAAVQASAVRLSTTELLQRQVPTPPLRPGVRHHPSRMQRLQRQYGVG